MMRYRNLLLVLMFALCWQSAVAQIYTELYGHISDTLKVEDSPFLVIDTIIIPQGEVLLIEPGVEVFVTDVNQQLYFWIYGNLIADGTPNSLISFKAFQPESPEDITWSGLFYYRPQTNTDTTDFQFSYLSIENSAFGVRVSGREGHLTAHHNIFSNCWHGIYLLNSPASEVYQNTFYGMQDNGLAYSLTNYYVEPELHIFENNIISQVWEGVHINWDYDLYDVDCDQFLIDYNCFDVLNQAVSFQDEYCDFDSLNNIFDDPLFYDADFYLRDDSPCIDAGNPSYPWDPDDTPPDMGAVYFRQTFQPVNYDHIIPDTLAVADHPYWDIILAAGNPTPVNEMIYPIEGVSYDSTSGLLTMNPTLADTGVYRLGFRAQNIHDDSTWVDSLVFDLHIIPNTSPILLDFLPRCDQQSGDTTLCQGYFPLDQVTFSVIAIDGEGDHINYHWRYLENTYSYTNSFTTQLEHQGENLVEFFCDDGVDTTWHFWSVFASGSELSGLIEQELLTEEEGPYVMLSTTWVAEGDTLVVEPGVKIYVTTHLDDNELQVRGYLKVQGTEEQTVQFFSNSDYEYLWEGIRVMPGSQGAEMSYMELSSARRGVFVQYSDGPVVLSNCEFLWDSIGVQSHYSDLEVRNCVFDNSIGQAIHYAIFIEGDGETSIKNCGFGRVFDPIYLYRADAEIVNNTFGHAGYPTAQLLLHPITALISDVRVVNNIFYKFSDVAMFDSESNWSEVAYNCFYADTLIENTERVSNNIHLDSEFSLFEDPLMVLEVGNLDFHLQETSPCIDSGDPYLLDPDGSRSDMGMYGGPGAGVPETSGEFIPDTRPAVFSLTRIFPNPFNATTNIDFNLPETGNVRLEVFNLRGQRIALLLDGEMNAGRQIISFEGNNVASGIYLVRLQQGTHIATGKMLLVK